MLQDFRKGKPLGVLALEELTPKHAQDLQSRLHRAAEIALIEGR